MQRQKTIKLYFDPEERKRVTMFIRRVTRQKNLVGWKIFAKITTFGVFDLKKETEEKFYNYLTPEEVFDKYYVWLVENRKI